MVSGPGSPPSSLKFNTQSPASTTPLSNQQQQLNNTITTPQNSTAGSLSQRLASLASFSERRTSERGERGTGGEEKSHRKNFSLSGKSWMDKSSSSATKSTNSASPLPAPPPPIGCSDRLRLMGTVACPRLDDVPMLEPLVCKKVAHERLTALLFREDCVVTACQDGIVCTWARPNSSSSNNSMPHQTNNDDHGGTMV